jgi:hypothetical protein
MGKVLDEGQFTLATFNAKRLEDASQVRSRPREDVDVDLYAHAKLTFHFLTGAFDRRRTSDQGQLRFTEKIAPAKVSHVTGNEISVAPSPRAVLMTNREQGLAIGNAGPKGRVAHIRSSTTLGRPCSVFTASIPWKYTYQRPSATNRISACHCFLVCFTMVY